MRRKQKGFGCLQAVGVGCLAFVVLGLVVALVVYYKWQDWGRSLAATGVELAADSMLDGLAIPEDEKVGAMKPIKEFARKIRDGEVTLEQAAAVGEALAEGPALAAVMARGFEVKYLLPSELPEAEKKAGHVTISRFVNGVSTRAIPMEKAEEIGDVVTVETTDSEGNTTSELKESLTTEELRSCLKTMKDAADAAGVEDREFKVDLGAEIEKAIQAGLDKAPAGEPTE